MIKLRSIVLLSILILLPVSYASAQQQQIPWNEWVAQARTEAIEKGIRPEVFDEAFKNIKAPHRKTLNLDRKQPEKRLTYLKYRNTRGDPYRIKIGKSKYKKYQASLEEVGDQFGVSPCIITSIWGLETSYGNYMGNFPVIQSLATLAYDQRRGKYFRKQLFIALKIVNDGHVNLQDFKGEWAGASGQPQFMPSSWYEYAVDYDNNGVKDIWKSLPDSFASIANYLAENGWQRGQPWYYEVTVPANFDDSLLGKEHKLPVNQWEQIGVQRIHDSIPAEDQDLEASIIKPYGGPYLMIFKNFDVIKRYNNSNYYAGTVGYMADKICNIAL